MLPDPLTPADSDLRDFQFMPLDVVRFAQSDLVSMEDSEAVLAALLLWGAAWHATPAGSLTDDDRVLAKAAGYGRSVNEWLRIKPAAMRGFVTCSDGRLYHPVVAEKVIESWTGKLKQRHRTFCAAIRKHNERDKEKADQRPSPSFEEWLEIGRPQAVVTAPKSPRSRVTSDEITRDDGERGRDIDSMSRAGHAENASKGQGQGQGHPIDIGTTSLLSDPASPIVPANDHAEPSTALVLSGEPSPTPKRGKAKAEPTPAEQADFDAFWSVYPRREAKKAALEAFLAVVRSGRASAQDVFNGAVLYAASREGENPKFTALPASWLNGRRWEDEIQDPPQGGYHNHTTGRPGWDPMEQAIAGIDFNEDFAA